MKNWLKNSRRPDGFKVRFDRRQVILRGANFVYYLSRSESWRIERDPTFVPDREGVQRVRIISAHGAFHLPERSAREVDQFLVWMDRRLSRARWPRLLAGGVGLLAVVMVLQGLVTFKVAGTIPSLPDIAQSDSYSEGNQLAVYPGQVAEPLKVLEAPGSAGGIASFGLQGLQNVPSAAGQSLSTAVAAPMASQASLPTASFNSVFPTPGAVAGQDPLAQGIYQNAMDVGRKTQYESMPPALGDSSYGLENFGLAGTPGPGGGPGCDPGLAFTVPQR